ncbi:MAG: leucine-rich repeat protein, partial [Metamycoplasmataceae bacterium]
KNTLIPSSLLIGFSSILSFGLVVANNDNHLKTTFISNNIDNDLKMTNENILDNNLNLNNKQFEGKILTKTDVENLEWNIKSIITLQDWMNDAPNVTIIDNQAFENFNIESLEIPNKVTLIGDNAFNNTSFLSSIIIKPASELVEIGNNAFNNSRITSINLPNSVTKIGNNAFQDTILLQGGMIEMLVTLKQKSLIPLYGFTQGQWNAITWRDIPFQGQTLTKNELIKIGWENKISITLDDWALDAPKVTRIDSYTFENLILSSIEIPNKVIDIFDNAFLNTSSLNLITLPYHLYVDAGSTIPNYGFTQSQWDSIIWDDYPKVGIINKIIAKELLRKSSIISWKEISEYDAIDNEAFQNTDISSIRIERKKNFSIGNNAFSNTVLLNVIELSVMYKDIVSNLGFTEEQIAIIEYIDEVIIPTWPRTVAKNVIIVGGVLIIMHITLWTLDWNSVKRKRLLLSQQEKQLKWDNQKYIKEQSTNSNDNEEIIDNDNFYESYDEDYDDYQELD